MMKKKPYLLVIFVIAIIFLETGCGSYKNPTETVGAFFNALKKGHYADAKKYLAPDTLKEITRAESFTSYAKALPWRPYLDSWEITDQKINGNEATVQVKMKFTIGGFQENWAVHLKKMEKHWKITGNGPDNSQAGDISGSFNGTPLNPGDVAGSSPSQGSSSGAGSSQGNNNGSGNNSSSSGSSASANTTDNWLDKDARENTAVPFQTLYNYYEAISKNDTGRIRQLCTGSFLAGRGIDNAKKIGSPDKIEILAQEVKKDQAIVNYSAVFKNNQMKLTALMVTKDGKWVIDNINLWFEKWVVEEDKE